MRLCILSIISGVFSMGSLVAQENIIEVPQDGVKDRKGKPVYVIKCHGTKIKCQKVPGGTYQEGQTTYKSKR